jgi:outer membrane protein assembly factor BamC
MQVRNIVLGFAVVSLLAGCSIFDRKQVDYKAGAIQTQPLEVPPDLTVPESEQRYTIPGTDGAKVASYSEYTRKAAEQPCVAPASAPAAATPAPAAAARIHESNGTKSILLGEPFDRSWRKVGLALERARIVATDKDRSKGIYFVAAAPGKDKRKRPDLQIVVRENARNSEVTVVDADGKSNAETTRLVETLYQNLDK